MQRYQPFTSLTRPKELTEKVTFIIVVAGRPITFSVPTEQVIDTYKLSKNEKAKMLTSPRPKFEREFTFQFS